MTRQERDQLITVMTELREFRRSTESSLRTLQGNVELLMAAHNERRGWERMRAALWSVGGGLVGSGITALTGWLKH